MDLIQHTVAQLLAGASVRDSIAEAADRRRKKDEPEHRKNPHAVALGKLGAVEGGEATSKSRSKAQKVKIAKHAANVRWKHETD